MMAGRRFRLGHLFFVIYCLVVLPNASSREFSLNFGSDTDFQEMAEKLSKMQNNYEDLDLVKARETYTTFASGSCISSMHRLSLAYKAEGLILRETAKIVRREKDIDKATLDLHREIRAERKKELQSKTFLSHPLNVLHFLRRQAFRFPMLLDSLVRTYAVRQEIWTIQGHREAAGCLISARDVNGTLLGLIRLARAYRLDKEAMLNGKFESEVIPLPGGDAMHPMRMVDVAMLILIGHSAGLHDDVVSWAEAILPKMEHKMHEIQFIIEATFRAIGVSFEAVKDYQSALAVWQSLMPPEEFRDKTSLSIAEIKEKMKRLENLLRTEGQPDHRDINRSNEHVEDLCRNDIKKIWKYWESPLTHCKMVKPFGGWYGYKTEVLSTDPAVMLFHNVLTREEARWLQNEVKPRLAPSKIVNTVDEGIELSDDHRRSESNGVWDRDGEVAVRLSKRISMITGMRAENRDSVSDSEGFQMVNYGIAGHYQPHQDQLHDSMMDPKSGILPVSLHGSGNRLATWLFYVSEAEAGGATVFTNLNISVPAVQGSALFWFSLHPNGSGDERLFHSGCPVLLGDKWIANKFIYQIGGSKCTSDTKQDVESLRLTNS